MFLCNIALKKFLKMYLYISKINKNVNNNYDFRNRFNWY